MTSEIIKANLKVFSGVHQLQVDFKKVYILCCVYISVTYQYDELKSLR